MMASKDFDILKDDIADNLEEERSLQVTDDLNPAPDNLIPDNLKPQ